MPLAEAVKFVAADEIAKYRRHHHQGRHSEDLEQSRDAQERVLIAGAGPVGLVAAAHLARSGVPVTVFEQGPRLSEESRASTFHPPTLDMLHALGAAEPLIAQGLKAPAFQYRTKKHGLLAQFDFAAIADATAHPYRVQCEQSKLTRILYDQMRGHPNFELQFDSPVAGVSQDGVERRGHDRAQRPHRAARRALPDRRRRREQHGAALARHRVRRLHLAGPAAGGVDAVRLPQRHSRPHLGELRGRSGALVFPAANSRAVARDVPGQRGRERRARADARIRPIADGRRGAGHLELRDRPHHALQGAPARGEDLSGWAAPS